MANHQVVSHEDWIEARRQLLAKEKEFTQLRDQLSQQRRDLPWKRVDKPDAFEGPNGTETLAQLFDGRSQLRRLLIPRSRAEGARRGRSAAFDGMGALSRQLRALARSRR
jgi:predicted dithiol-disulfide oxidoreductase (DUF899 family)